ncbi:MAG: DUF2382 domain-containing protein, partial [Leptolyngbyaceae cyanobacterium SM1_4_3]|nr:DUF2382 domain-containing protein [Leptolyngbyaceae cyanobacterium SM1_4_3]
MALVKFKDAYPDYRNNFGDSDAIPFDSFNVYSQSDEQIGSVKDALIDEQEGRFRYLIVDTGFWVFGKKVLLPIGIARFDYDARRIYVDGLTKEQVENLPEFTDDLKVDQDYEESVRAGYRPLAAQPGTQPVDAGTQPLGEAATAGTAGMGTAALDETSYSYDRDYALYNRDEIEDQPLRLYEERLVANKSRVKTGEVSVGKHVETETARVSVPVEKERVVIERTAPTDATRAEVGTHDFREGEVARMEVYEETPDIHKEAVVREMSEFTKRSIVKPSKLKMQIRREELDIDT